MNGKSHIDESSNIPHLVFKKGDRIIRFINKNTHNVYIYNIKIFI